jgi:hypothetical protein
MFSHEKSRNKQLVFHIICNKPVILVTSGHISPDIDDPKMVESFIYMPLDAPGSNPHRFQVVYHCRTSKCPASMALPELDTLLQIPPCFVRTSPKNTIIFVNCRTFLCPTQIESREKLLF